MNLQIRSLRSSIDFLNFSENVQSFGSKSIHETFLFHKSVNACHCDSSFKKLHFSIPSPPIATRSKFLVTKSNKSKKFVLNASSGGGDIVIPPTGGGGGGNGGGNDNDSDDFHEGGGKENKNDNIFSFSLWSYLQKSWNARITSDPNFGFKLAVECFNDACIILAVNYATRGKRFLYEFEFVLCHLAVSLLNDAFLVWLLAPIPLDPHNVRRSFLHNLPQHVFQSGNFTLPQRIGCYFYKGALYGLIGFLMGIIGTALVHALVDVRERVDSSFEPPSTTQPILRSGLTWMLYMSISSNSRYQVVNGMEQLLYKGLPLSLARMFTFGMRLGNNVLGSMNFVVLSLIMKLAVPRTPKEKSKLNYV